MKSEPHDKEECPDWVLAWESEYTEEELLAQARESYVEWRVSRSILIASALIVLFSFFLFTGSIGGPPLKNPLNFIYKTIEVLFFLVAANLCHEIRHHAKWSVAGLMALPRSCPFPGKGIRLYRKRMRHWKKRYHTWPRYYTSPPLASKDQDNSPITNNSCSDQEPKEIEWSDRASAMESKYTEEERLAHARKYYVIWEICRIVRVFSFSFGGYAFWKYISFRVVPDDPPFCYSISYDLLAIIAVLCIPVYIGFSELQESEKWIVEDWMGVKNVCQRFTLWPSKGIRLYRQRLREWKKLHHTWPRYNTLPAAAPKELNSSSEENNSRSDQELKEKERSDRASAPESMHTEEEILANARQSYVVWEICRIVRVFSFLFCCCVFLKLIITFGVFKTVQPDHCWYDLLALAALVCVPVYTWCSELQESEKWVVEDWMGVKSAGQRFSLTPSQGIRLYRKRMSEWKNKYHTLPRLAPKEQNNPPIENNSSAQEPKEEKDA